MIIFLIIEAILVIIPIFLSVYALFYIIGDIKGAPYVPTTDKFVDAILKQAKLKKDQVFVELGSGDGRVTREAVQKYGVQGIGYDINPLLIYYSRLISYLRGGIQAKFFCRDLFKIDLSEANVIFLFLLPRTLKKLLDKMERECKKGTLVIAHGFPLIGWEKKLTSKIDRKLFPTFFYQL